MADNIVLNAGSGGATLAADDISSVWYPIQKLAFGALDTATLVTTSAGLPVNIVAENASVTVDNAGAFAVQTELPDAIALAEGMSNPTAPQVGAHLLGLAGDGLWYRLTVLTPADAESNADVSLNTNSKLQIFNGTTWDRARGDIANGLDVDVTRLPVLPAGTNNIGDVDVLSVVPGTGATSLGKAIDSVGGATDTGVAPLAVRDDALSALTPIEGDYVALRTDANGALWVHDDALDAALGGSELQVDIVAALPAGTNNIGDVDVLSLVPGTGATALGKAEDAAHGSGDTGVYVLAVRDDVPGPHSGADNDYESLHTDANGALWVTMIPKGTGGCSFFKSIDLDETEEEVKATAATFKGGIVMNLTNALIYLKLYNATAASVTVGTTTPDLTIPIPGNNDTDGAGFILPVPPEGVEFTTALSAAATTGIADNDTGAPAANAVAVALWFE